MCHYRQHAHADPLVLVGLQDITAHVDFSAIAQAAVETELSLLGYTSQAQFLINCGITDVLAATPADDAAAYLPLASQVQRLTSPAEMGELFKVIALGRGIDFAMLGFKVGDRRHTL
jgi:SAM-dependent MidA family methyltransferase